jgi:hypothetical protein
MLKNGTRQDMKASTYDTMRELKEWKDTQWTRAVLDSNLTTVMTNISTHCKVPDYHKRSSLRERSERASD